MPASRPLEERFWEKVDKQGPTGPYVDTPCWIWTACKLREGYGQIAVTTGKTKRAHRVSWELHNGPIPSGMHVLHRCHNRACVNPSHLYLGRDLENTRDKYRSGRANHVKGSTHPRARLSDKDVLTILRMRASGEGPFSIAKKLQLSHRSVRSICLGQTWRHIDRSQFRFPPVKQSNQKGSANNKAKLTEPEVIKIRALHKSGLSARSIASLYSVTSQCIRLILIGKTWGHIETDLNQ